jgi:hypothetical protein
MAGFGISGVERLVFAARELVHSETNIRKVSCEDVRWIELATDHVLWCFVTRGVKALVSTTRELIKMALRKIGCKNGMWIELALDMSNGGI